MAKLYNFTGKHRLAKATAELLRILADRIEEEQCPESSLGAIVILPVAEGSPHVLTPEGMSREKVRELLFKCFRSYSG